MKNIQSFEDACKALNIPTELPVFPSYMLEERKKGLSAHFKLTVIAEALNEGWKPNWNNDSERKYFPWFWVNAGKDHISGSGLSSYNCVYSGSGTVVGSRLCFKSWELAKYAGETFNALYKDYLLYAE